MFFDEALKQIRSLEKFGVLGAEECPEEHYAHWSVRKPEELPDWLRSTYINYGEVRYYWL